MAIAAVPLLAGAGGTAAGTAAVVGTAAAASAATAAAAAAATWSTGAIVAATALGGAIMIGSMVSGGGSDEVPETTVEELDPTATDELETEQERNANLRRKIYSKDNLLSKETADETEGLTLLGA